MSAISEVMSYDDLKAFLKSVDASDEEIYRIFGYLNSSFRCTVKIDSTLIVIKDVHYSSFYRVTLHG